MFLIDWPIDGSRLFINLFELKLKIFKMEITLQVKKKSELN